jgi:hypothetical protein
MRLLLAILAMTLGAAPSAFAQSYWLHAADLRSDGHSVGQVTRMAVKVDWKSATTASLRYSDDTVDLEAQVDLKAKDTFLSAGVGVRVLLEETGEWTVAMEGQAWAPVLSSKDQRPIVALPFASPVRSGRLPLAAGEAKPPPDSRPWSFRVATTKPEAASACDNLILSAAPDSKVSWRVPTEIEVVLGKIQGRWRLAEAHLEGFSVQGYVPKDFACHPAALGGLGLSGTGAGCGDGMTHGRAVILPAGTELFPTAEASRSFAKLKREVHGLEHLTEPTATSCAGKKCERVPAEPKGAARWIVDLDCQKGPHALLEGWVKTPAETLRDVTPGNRNPGGGFGLCSSAPDGWPR